MSIATAIQNAQNKVVAAYTAAGNKGATLPSTQNLNNLATTINSISLEGSSPTILNYVVLNGSTVTISNITKDTNVLGATATTVPSNTYQGAYTGNNNVLEVNLSSIKTVSNYGLGGNSQNLGTFKGCIFLSKLGFNNLTSIGQYGLGYSFYGCIRLNTEISFPSLTSINSYSMFHAFENTNITKIKFPSLQSVLGSSQFPYCFNGCSYLTSIEFPVLNSINTNTFYQAFQYCTALTNISFPSLSIINASQSFYTAFNGCTKLASISFPALTTTSFGSYINQFQNMLQNTGTNVTHTIHFPSNMESTISGLDGYPLFGGTSGYVVCAFDLPATS